MTALVASTSRVDGFGTHRAPASARLTFLRERGMGASVLVAAISSGFGVLLLTATGFLGAAMAADPFIGRSDTGTFVIGLLSVLLLAVAVYVAAVVTANTFSTIVAGRTRRIALLRLIGASARSQRSEVAGQGLAVGVIGAVVGLVLGTAAAALLVPLASAAFGIDVEYAVVQPQLLAPAVVVALTTWAAAWAGSRRVLTVTPLQAISGAAERTREQTGRRPGRHAAAIALFAIGAGLLAVGVLVGLVSPLGVIVAFFGGLFSFTGIAIGAALVMPPLLRWTGRLFGSSVPARMAAEIAMRYSERSSRMAIGVVIGVTLVTMFAVALETTKAVFTESAGGQLPQEVAAGMDSFAAVMMALVAVSAVIAAVGLVNLLTIGVVQRRRELGLLRALGLSSAQVRRMVLLEAAHITITAVVFGLVLGVGYGWAAAQSVFGSIPASLGLPVSVILPAVPWGPVVAIVVATAVLTLVASVAPTRLATRVAPVEALVEQ